MERATQWRLKELRRWEDIWRCCIEFMNAVSLKELRCIISEFLIKLPYNEWSAKTFGMWTMCESNNLQWLFSADNWAMAQPPLNPMDAHEVIMGKYPCSATVSRVVIDIHPPEKATYQIGFWNARTNSSWTIIAQSLDPFLSFGMRNHMDVLQLSRVHGNPPHCLTINIVDAKLELIAHSSNNVVQHTSVDFPTESEEHLHMFLFCYGIQVPTHFHIEYHGC